MLRVGLTGGLGSGKSTVAAMLARHGAHTLSADEIGRELMQPGQAVYAEIVRAFGPGVVRAGGPGEEQLDRTELARLAFAEGQLEQLNAIVHPAVITEQARRTAEIAARDPGAVVVVESALILETRHGELTKDAAARGQGPGSIVEPWRRRFDWLVLVTANDATKIARYVSRVAAGRRLEPEKAAALAEEARRRLARQMTDEQKATAADDVLANDGSLEELAARVDALWASLQARARGGDRG